MALNINGSTGISGVDGSASAPAVTGTDSNTGINFASDTVNINTAGSTRVTVDSVGNVGIGTTNPNGESINGSQNLVVMDTTSDGGMNIKTGTSGNAQIHFSDTSGNGQGRLVYAHADDSMKYFTNGTERMRIDANGRVMINTTSTGAMLRMRNTNLTTHTLMELFDDGGTGTHSQIQFNNTNGTVGQITTSGSSTTYATSSDYRLKENATAISDGITRLKTLKPYKFNFKADASTTLDGFFAHEVTAVPEAITGEKDATENCSNVVLDKDGNFLQENVTQEQWNAGKAEDPAIYPSDSTWSASYTKNVYQGIDQSKLVPLLTAALQEAVAKIEVLETKVAALEAG